MSALSSSRACSRDTGALSEANAVAVVEAGKDYVFRRTMFKLATRLLDLDNLPLQHFEAALGSLVGLHGDLLLLP